MSKRLIAFLGFLLFIAWLEIRRLRAIENQQRALSSHYAELNERTFSQMTPEEYAEFALFESEFEERAAEVLKEAKG